MISRMLPEIGNANHPVVIVRLRGRTDVGSTFLELVRRYGREISAADGRLMLAGVGPELLDQLERTGLIDVLGKDNVLRAHATVGASLEAATRHAEEWLSEQADSGLGGPDQG